jgi:hypothetical protein
MKRRLHLIAGLLFLLATAYSLSVWGGLVTAPGIGPVALEATRREVSLASVYAPPGSWLLKSSGLDRSAASFAAGRFADAQPRVLANPSVALDALVAGMPLDVRLAYYGAPFLLLLFAILWWLRPRGVQTLRR